MVFTEIDRNSLVKIGGGRCCAHKLRGYDGVAFSFETGENIDIKFIASDVTVTLEGKELKIGDKYPFGNYATFKIYYGEGQEEALEFYRQPTATGFALQSLLLLILLQAPFLIGHFTHNIGLGSIVMMFSATTIFLLSLTKSMRLAQPRLWRLASAMLMLIGLIGTITHTSW
jgi:hypothetical protein